MAAGEDFDTLHAVASFVLDAVPTVWTFSDNPTEKTKVLKEELAKRNLADASFIRRQRNALLRQILNPLYVLAHLFNIAVLAGLVGLLFMGPDVLLKGWDAGAIAKPLNVLQKALYGLSFAINMIAYLALGACRFVGAWIAVIRVWFFLRSAYK